MLVLLSCESFDGRHALNLLLCTAVLDRRLPELESRKVPRSPELEVPLRPDLDPRHSPVQQVRAAPSVCSAVPRLFTQENKCRSSEPMSFSGEKQRKNSQYSETSIFYTNLLSFSQHIVAVTPVESGENQHLSLLRPGQRN